MIKSKDSGFTLVEVLVVALLLSLVLLAVGGMLTSITTTQRSVTATTTTTSAAQVAASAIETGVRNASDVSAVFTPAGADQFFVVRTASQGTPIVWTCKAWYFSASGVGSIRAITKPDGAKIAAPSATQLSTWSVLVSDITPRTGTGVFTGVAGGVAVAYNARVGNGNQPVAIQMTALKRTAIAQANTCF